MAHLDRTRDTGAGGSGALKRFYSEAELAAYAGLSTRTLQGWRLRNQGPPWKRLCADDKRKHGAIRYDIQQFDAWLAAQPGGGQAA